MKTPKKIAIIGGGAAGFFASIHHKETSPENQITLFEQSKTVLNKVKISGGGRCNVTHACFDPIELAKAYPRGGKALIGPLHRFGPQDTIQFFESRGVKLKTEVDQRIFPYSDQSESIVNCLYHNATHLGVNIKKETSITNIQHEEKQFKISFNALPIQYFDQIIITTGSSRPMYNLLKKLGHQIITPIPSLFSFKINNIELQKLSGLSVEKVKVWLKDQAKCTQNGPLLITHWGVSGPAIIKLSSFQAPFLFEKSYKTELIIDWLPNLSFKSINHTLQHHRNKHLNQHLTHKSPFKDIPKRLWHYLIQKASLNPTSTWQQCSSKKIEQWTKTLKQSPFKIVDKGAFKEEFVTCGGVDLNEINFKTMESKKIKGLYFAGEVLNIDGITGGFNFQNAWTTGFIAGINP